MIDLNPILLASQSFPGGIVSLTLLGIIFALLIVLMAANPKAMLVFMFSVGMPLSYSYAIFTNRDPGSGLVWPRVIRDGLFLLLAIAMFVRSLQSGHMFIWRRIIFFPLIVFIVYNLGLALFSVDLPLTTFWIGIKYYLVLPSLGIALPMVVRNEDTIQVMVISFLGFSVFVAIVGLVEIFLGKLLGMPGGLFMLPYATGSLFGFRIFRASSTWGNPLSLAGYLGLVLGFWHSVYRYLPKTFQSWRYYFVSLILWGCFILTLSRSSIIALLVSFGIAQIILFRNRLKLIWGLILMFAIIPVMNIITWIRKPSAVGNLFQIPENLRFDVWKKVLAKFLQFPIGQMLFGRGLGSNSGLIRIGSLEALGSDLDKIGALATDSFYLTLIFESGIFGLFIFIFVSIYYIYTCVKLCRSIDNSFMHRVTVALLSGLTFLLIRNIFLQGMRTSFAGFYFWILIGLLISLHDISHRDELLVEQEIYAL